MGRTLLCAIIGLTAVLVVGAVVFAGSEISSLSAADSSNSAAMAAGQVGSTGGIELALFCIFLGGGMIYMFRPKRPIVWDKPIIRDHH
jgi:hypothetical protein